MKVSSIQAGLYPNILQQRNKKPCTDLCAIKNYNQEFRGMNGSIAGLCFGGILGYLAPIGLGLLGLGLNCYTALATLVIFSGAGAYGGNKLEDKIDDKLNNKK